MSSEKILDLADFEEDAQSPSNKPRKGTQWTIPAILLAALLLEPLLAVALFSASFAGWAVLGLYALTTGILAYIDGRTFRASWSISLVAGFGFFLAASMYFPQGTWIYIALLVFLAWVCSKMGSAVSTKTSSHIPRKDA